MLPLSLPPRPAASATGRRAEMSIVTISTRAREVPCGTAAHDFLNTDLAPLRSVAQDATPADIERALTRSRRDLRDFAALLSPAAESRLEAMAQLSHATTVQRFGKTAHLFAPLYLSNECVSVCTYCGFSATNDIVRRTLSVEEVVLEAKELVRRGFSHVLLVSGEHARIVSKGYVRECIEAIAQFVPQISVEVQAWDTETYRSFVEAGCDGLVVYQETYDRSTYADVHLKGKKRNYDWRLAALDRGAQAGMRRLGIGALFGLHDDWRSEALAMAVHAQAMIKRWWRCEVAVALPRLRPCAGPGPAGPGLAGPEVLDDRSMTQLICALRLGFPDISIVLSTRERAELRDALLPLGVTTLSAGSHTEPGGYVTASDAEPQFDIADTRSPDEFVAMLRGAGYDPVWKDWQRTS